MPSLPPPPATTCFEDPDDPWAAALYDAPEPGHLRGSARRGSPLFRQDTLEELWLDEEDPEAISAWFDEG
jgi:hypothetical protein